MKKILLLNFLFTISFLQAQHCPDGVSAYQTQQYDKAVKSLSDCAKRFPTDSSLVFMIGNSLLQLKEYKKAIPFLEKSITQNYQPVGNTHYLLGLSYAAIKNSKQSISNLNMAASTGFSGYLRLDSTQFSSIRDETDFKKAKDDIYKNAFPCLKDNNNNKFDFWLGEWDVLVNGQKRADSKITKAKGGCAVHEDYVVLSGVYSGQSISYYDPTENRWEQYWVGSGGDKSKYYETEKYDADMQFIWKSKNPNGTESWTRMSYVTQDANTVIQTLESSSDGGVTWTPAFNGTYKRKE